MLLPIDIDSSATRATSDVAGTHLYPIDILSVELAEEALVDRYLIDIDSHLTSRARDRVASTIVDEVGDTL